MQDFFLDLVSLLPLLAIFSIIAEITDVKMLKIHTMFVFLQNLLFKLYSFNCFVIVINFFKEILRNLDKWL